MQLRLVIANKNYSSWSMRPWVVLREAGIAFEEQMVPFETAAWANRIPAATPTGQVPVLWISTGAALGDEPVWESLAIVETIAELFPDKRLWPTDARARRRARAVSAQMHAGFADLRRQMPMNIGADLAGKGHTPEALADAARIAAIWTECRETFGGSGAMLFGEFSIADAMFAPIVMRFATYGVELPPVAAAYADAVRELTSVQQWCDAARRETAFVAHDEPYRTR